MVYIGLVNEVTYVAREQKEGFISVDFEGWGASFFLAKVEIASWGQYFDGIIRAGIDGTYDDLDEDASMVNVNDVYPLFSEENPGTANDIRAVTDGRLESLVRALYGAGVELRVDD